MRIRRRIMKMFWRNYLKRPWYVKSNCLKAAFPYLILIAINSACAQNNDSFVWPNGAKAAVCLTYDDGLPSHVNTVGPMLKKYGLKGTFYPTLSSSSLLDDVNKWKGLAKDGHELGKHTVYHPCRKSQEGMDWVKDYLDLDQYTADQIVGEIDVANAFLQSLDGQKRRTFAYPCAHTKTGGHSYVDSLSVRFTASRYSSESQMEMPALKDINLHMIPSWAPNKNNAGDLIGYVNQIIENKTLSSFTFHGVGAEHMRVSAQAHEELLQYLQANRDRIWVATVQEVADYLKSKSVEDGR